MERQEARFSGMMILVLFFSYPLLMKKLYSTSKFSMKKTMPIKNMVNRFLPTWSNLKGLVKISSPKNKE